MGRTSTFNDQSIYTAIGEQLVGNATVTLQDVVSRTNVSVGSLYHRFGSREEMLASAWLDAAKTFQARFITELTSGAFDAGENAAMATPRFCRAEPARASILICCRREELISKEIPAEIKAQIETANCSVSEKLSEFAKAYGYTAEACQLGLIAFPLGAVRHYLPHRNIPKQVDTYVAAAFRSAVGIKA